MCESNSLLPAVVCPSLQEPQFKCQTSKTSIRLKSSSVFSSSCRICLSAIFEPAALTCGHTFCEACLSQYWHMKEKPEFLICPLCRAHVYNVDFIEKEVIPKPSIREFRNNFSFLDTVPTEDRSNSSFLCVKITMLIPIFYYMLLWLKHPIWEMFSLLRWKL